MRIRKYTNEILAGKKFNFLTFISIDRRTKNQLLCRWKCDCGKEITGDFYAIRSGRKQCCGCHLSKKRENNPMWSGVGEMPGFMWGRIVCEAKIRSIKVRISKSYIWKLFLRQNRKCALTGEILIFPSRYNGTDGTASLDRIDSKKDYVRENVQWVHKDVNKMKNDYNQSYFVKMCKKISNYNENAAVAQLAGGTRLRTSAV